MKPMDDSPLDEHLVRAFARELNNQYKLAHASFNALRQIETSFSPNVDDYWYHIESSVKSLMAMTNILWSQNSRNPYKRRARLLRQRFMISDFELPSDLRNTRHGLEHFDERLDEWWRDEPLHNLSDRGIGPMDSFGGLSAGSFARHYDPGTGVLSVFGSAVNLRESMKFMEKVMIAVTISGALSDWPKNT